MNKKLSKFIALIICLCLMLNSFIYANPNSKMEVISPDGQKISVKILADNSSIKKVLVTEGNQKHIIEYHKKNKTMDTIMYKADKVVKKEKFDLTNTEIDDIGETQANTLTASGTNAGSTIVASNFSKFWSFSYCTFKNQSLPRYSWIIRADPGKAYINEFSSNSGDLHSFKSAVDSVVSNQIAFYAAGGAAVFGIVGAALTAPTGLGFVVGVVTAAGGSVACAVALWNA